ncbi:MAG: ABC transporter permease [Anaerolineaceae bacterium]|jgi:ABC-type dipeptide/oligopeptide/nickel transport system permease component|nr:MAG: ABC transporter permease [Anaerolineaceae bacterium]
MGRYIVKRILILIPLLLAISLFTFFLVHLAPGDPIATQFGMNMKRMEPERIEAIREELGLNDPLAVQYLRYLGNLLKGDMGQSLTTKKPVLDEISARLPATIQLTLAAMFVSLLLAIPLGILSAVKRGSIVDKLGMSGALLGVSMPSFWVGIMLMLLFSLQLGWLPSSGRGDGTTVGTIKALILPALTLGMALMGLTTRLMRSSMLEVLGQDYMQTARAKGLRSTIVLNRHGLRNALIPVVTIVGLQFASLLGGAVIVETIFAWPGIGRLAVNAILRRDYPVIMGTVLVFAVVFILMNLLVDLFYTLIDPRINFD